MVERLRVSRLEPAAGCAGSRAQAHRTPPVRSNMRSVTVALQGALPPVEQKPGLTQTEDILNSILPPRCGGFSNGLGSAERAAWMRADRTGVSALLRPSPVLGPAHQHNFS